MTRIPGMLTFDYDCWLFYLSVGPDVVQRFLYGPSFFQSFESLDGVDYVTMWSTPVQYFTNEDDDVLVAE